MKNFKVEVNTEEELHIFKFVALLTVAMDYFICSEEILTDNMEKLLSTKYKSRFLSLNRKEKRTKEKLHAEELRKFKTQFNEFRKKNNAMLEHLDMIKMKDPKMFENIIEAVFEMTDNLITKSS